MTTMTPREFLNKATSLNGHASRQVTELFRYSTAGTTAAILDFTVLIALVEIFHVNYLYAAAIGFIVGTTTSFTIDKKGGFKATKRGFKQGLLIFATFSGICLILTIFTLKFVVENLEMNYIIAKFLVAIIISILNFALNYNITFGDLK
jgi:putative flippase GtrA